MNNPISTAANAQPYLIVLNDRLGGTNIVRSESLSSKSNEGAITIAVVNDSQGKTMQFALHQNYANPFIPSTTIQISLPQSGFTTLKVYHVLGMEVAPFISEEQQMRIRL